MRYDIEIINNVQQIFDAILGMKLIHIISKAKMTGVAYKINASGNLKKLTNAEINNLTFVSFFSTTFKYSIGKIIKPEKPFDLNLFDACASGIHGFLNINLAKNYIL